MARDPRLAGRKAVVAKLGMDAHWRGVIVVAHALRDAGMEVVYLGHATSGQLVTAVVQEDPALVGLSSLSGNVWIATDFSGNPTLRQPGDAGAGQINEASLEGSTVDLGTEFTRMITTQRMPTESFSGST